eukprot:g10517.t1
MAQAEEIRTETGPLDYDYTEKEVELCQENLQNHKACSPDKIKNEMLKYGGTRIVSFLVRFFNWLKSCEYTPSDWGKAIIVNIPKGGDPTDPENWRDIAILSCLGTIETWCASLSRGPRQALLAQGAVIRQVESIIEQADHSGTDSEPRGFKAEPGVTQPTIPAKVPSEGSPIKSPRTRPRARSSSISSISSISSVSSASSTRSGSSLAAPSNALHIETESAANSAEQSACSSPVAVADFQQAHDTNDHGHVKPANWSRPDGKPLTPSEQELENVRIARGWQNQLKMMAT